MGLSGTGAMVDKSNHIEETDGKVNWHKLKQITGIFAMVIKSELLLYLLESEKGLCLLDSECLNDFVGVETQEDVLVKISVIQGTFSKEVNIAGHK